MPAKPRPQSRRRPWLAAWLRPYEVDEAHAGRFRARQLQAVLRLTPLGLITNIVNVFLVVWATWGHGSAGFMLPWAALVIALAVHGMYGWWRSRRAPPREAASARAIRRATMAAASLAALWGVMAMVQFPGLPPGLLLLLAVVITGMICAGGFALATVPEAGVAYVLVLGLGGALALARSSIDMAPVIGALLLLYCVIVITSVRSTSRLFGARLMAEAEAERQNEVIGLLLRDFEEHSSDVLWEIGRDGCLRHASSRLSRLFGRSIEGLGGMSVMDLLIAMLPDDDEARAQLTALSRALRGNQPFRDLVLPLHRDGRTLWWSLSAKPLRDEAGRADGWRGVASDVTAARQATRKLSWLAHNDALTGLANRLQFRHRLAALLAEGVLLDGKVSSHAVLCLDLDHFKAVNDRLGHAAGDALLQSVAERLRSVVRRSDLVARLGGDEFAILLPNTDIVEADRFAERLLEVLRQPCTVEGLQLSTQASIGVALAPRDGNDVDDLVNHADLALYAVKASGRNGCCVYTPDLAESSRRRVRVEMALRSAIDRRELRLVFQPQLRFSDWTLAGCEALLRWEHPELGSVSPVEFIPVAEDAGLMPAIGDWVLTEACRQAATWSQPLVVSVNVSPRQALGTGFVDRVQAALDAVRLPASRLELEITESVFLDESPATLGALRQLRNRGVRIALDDFGTGYSALSYLRAFPFDTLKIDRSFIRELATRGEARAIVKMILGLAHTLGMQTVAEGVEEPVQAQMLRRHGCHVLQGFLLSRPIPADELIRFLQAWRGRPAGWSDTELAPSAPMPLAALPEAAALPLTAG